MESAIFPFIGFFSFQYVSTFGLHKYHCYLISLTVVNNNSNTFNIYY